VGRLGDAMQALRSRGEKAFVPYLTSGDPSMARTRELWRALDRAGADVIEVGVPFSDPLADGPTIQRASARALAAGASLPAALDALGEERAGLRARAVIFTYLNPILAMGVGPFALRAAAVGADGVLVPDLIPEEGAVLRGELASRGLDLVALVAPTTPESRMELIGLSSPALVYAVSVAGVTGARGELAPDLEEFISRCRRRIDSPLVIGFGISTPAQAARAALLADGVVVGSALVELVEKHGDSPELATRIEEAAREFARAVKSARAGPPG